MTATVTVYEVCYTDAGPGPYGDGVTTYRTRDYSRAEAVAAIHRHYNGPATVARVSVPRRLAQRWGLA